MKLSPFDFLNSINSASRKSLFAEHSALDGGEATPDSPSKNYVPFVINRSLSYFQDTILLANEMNMNHHLPPKMQYDFLKNAVKPRKRFAKWAKTAPDGEMIDHIVMAYQCSRTRAREFAEVMSPEDAKEFSTRMRRHKDGSS